MKKLNVPPEFLIQNQYSKRLSQAKHALGEARLPFSTVQIYRSGNATDIRVVQNSQPLNKQHERIAEWKQSVMHVEHKRLE